MANIVCKRWFWFQVEMKKKNTRSNAADQSAPVQLTIPRNKLPCNDDKRGKVNKKPHVKLTWRSFVTFGTLIWHPQFVPIILNEELKICANLVGHNK